MNIPKGYNFLEGDNGSGKTLFLDYISGLNKDKNKCISGNESIIYINQNIYFSDRLTVKDFVTFSYGIDNKKSIRSFYIWSDSFMERSRIDELLEKQWGMLSGGERKFLYAFVLLSFDREWYILDEPFAFVDKEKKQLLRRIIEKKLNEGKGIILTSHEEVEVEGKGKDINVLMI